MGCPNYLALVYLHLAIACAIAFCSAEFITGITTNSAGFWINVAISFAALMGVIYANPGSPFQYLCWILFAVTIGQNSQLFYEDDKKDNVLTRILLMLAGLFAGMTALGFYDRQHILGFGPYLFAGLLGLLAAELGYVAYLWGGGKDTMPLSYISDFGIFLFSIYIAYHTQELKQNALRCKIPNYPDDSLGLFLDLANLFNFLSSR